MAKTEREAERMIEVSPNKPGERTRRSVEQSPNKLRAPMTPREENEPSDIVEEEGFISQEEEEKQLRTPHKRSQDNI